MKLFLKSLFLILLIFQSAYSMKKFAFEDHCDWATDRAYRIVFNDSAIDSSLGSQEYSPLYAAVLNNDSEGVKNLLNQKFDPNFKSIQNGRSLLHAVIIYRADIEILKSIIKFNGDINAQDKKGNTPLHLALYMWFKIFSKPQAFKEANGEYSSIEEMLVWLRNVIEFLILNGADTGTIKNNKNVTCAALADQIKIELDNLGFKRLICDEIKLLMWDVITQKDEIDFQSAVEHARRYSVLF